MFNGEEIKHTRLVDVVPGPVLSATKERNGISTASKTKRIRYYDHSFNLFKSKLKLKKQKTGFMT